MDEIEEYPEVYLETLSKVKHKFHLARLREHEERNALIISFYGRYSEGSRGNNDAVYMLAVTAAGIEAWQPAAIVFDLRSLEYSWGDRIQNIFSAGRGKLSKIEDFLLGKSPSPVSLDIPTCAVVSKLSRKGIESLISTELNREPYSSLFDSISDAVRSIAE